MNAGTGPDPRGPVSMDAAVSVGVVGLGYWGPNLARNFAALEGCELRWCCDASAESARALGAALSRRRASPRDLDELLADPELDAVVIATHVPSHAPLALRALEAGKHCFVEKPLAQSAEEAAAVADGGRGGRARR